MRQFAEMAGISNPYLSQIERGLREPSQRVVDAIARSLEISVDALYAEAGIEPHPSRRRRTRAQALQVRSRTDRPASGARCSRSTTDSSALNRSGANRPSRRRRLLCLLG